MHAYLRALPLALLVVFQAVMPAADRPGQPVALSSNRALRPGTLIREKSEIRVELGKTRQEIGTDITNLNTNFLRRSNLVRRVIGADAEEVEVREFYQDSGHFMGAAPTEPNPLPHMLNSKTLRVRKKSGRWDYNLLQGTASASDQKVLNEMAFTADLLELLPICIGTTPRKPGETWETKMNSPRGKAYGWIVPDHLESTLVAVDDQPDGPLATIAISGKFRMERPMAFNARMEVTFTATVVRRLSDMLDVDTKITGQFVTVAAAITDKRETINLSYDYPFTITRTLKLEPK